MRIWQNWSTWNESKSDFRFPNEYKSACLSACLSACCSHVLNLFWDGCCIINCPWWTHGAWWRNGRRQTWTKVSRNARPCKNYEYQQFGLSLLHWIDNFVTWIWLTSFWFIDDLGRGVPRHMSLRPLTFLRIIRGCPQDSKTVISCTCRL